MVQNDFEKLQEAYTLRGIELHHLHERVDALETEINRLKELLKLQQQHLFGQKSEVASDLSSPASGNLDSIEETSTPKTTTVSSFIRNIPPRGKRTLDTSHLPKYTIIHDLAEAKKTCACCGGGMHEIGREVSEQLEIIPAKEHVRNNSYNLKLHIR